MDGRLKEVLWVVGGGGLQVKIVSVYVLYYRFSSLCQSVYIKGTGRGARQKKVYISASDRSII